MIDYRFFMGGWQIKMGGLAKVFFLVFVFFVSCKSVEKQGEAIEEELNPKEIENHIKEQEGMKVIKLYNQRKEVIQNANLTVNYVSSEVIKEGYIIDETLIPPFDIRLSCEGYHSFFYRNQALLPKKLILIDREKELNPASYFFDHQGIRVNCVPHQDKILTVINFTDLPNITKGIIDEEEILVSINNYLSPLNLVIDRHFLGKESMTRKLKILPSTIKIDTIGQDNSEYKNPTFEFIHSPYLNVFILKKSNQTDFLPENDPLIKNLYQQEEVVLVSPYFLEDAFNSEFTAYNSEIEIKFNKDTNIKRIKELLSTENLDINSSTEIGSDLYIGAKIKPEAGLGVGINTLKLRLETFPEVNAVKFMYYQPRIH